ncbi:hypothetical protein BC941DRAFT_420460 [Chlamydoabsidia padenii]|nr:hypothetical protein BC941DRAFT_420460 [Chlamydoabsidia padenii]
MTSILFYGILLMILLVMTANANMSPSYPEPGTVWTSGKEYEITWEEDNAEPTMNATWKNFRIDLMTGEDMDQTLLTNIAENVKGESLKYKYTVPEVTPHAPIYFLMFTSDDGEFAWSTRFAIVSEDGKQQVPEHSSQPSGEKIPWGVGKLTSSNDTSPSNKGAELVSVTSNVIKSAIAPSDNHQVSKSAVMQSQSASPPSYVASAHKENASASINKFISKAGSQHLASFTIVGAFISSVVGLFLF